VAAVAADHLQRFWNSSMKVALIEGHRKNLVELTPVAARAVEILAAAKTSAA
jgi:hypothetical protein